MATTLRHDPNLYLHALLCHRSDQRYLQLKCLERLNYLVTTQASLGISQYSLHMPSLCEVSREAGNDNPWPDFRSTPVFPRKGLRRAISSLVMLLVIILAAVSEKVLKKVLEWYAQHKNDPTPTQDNDADSRKKTTDIEEWDQKFMQVDYEIVLAANYMDIHKVILAANYMDIKVFLDVGCKTVANMIKGEPPDKIHKTSTQGRKVGQTPQNDDADSRKTTPGIEEWDAQHVLVNLYELPIPLLDVGCKTVANMIKGKLPEEIRKTFNIQNDFTLEIRKTFNIQNDFIPEEEDQIRRGNEWVDSRLEERNLLTKKTAGAGVSATLPTRRRGVTSFKKRPGSRDVPVVSLMSDLAMVDAFPCRVLRKSAAPELLGFGSGSFASSLGPSDLSTLLALSSLRPSTSNCPFRATYLQQLLSMALVKPDDELVIKPGAVAPNVNYADCAAGDVDLAMTFA